MPTSDTSIPVGMTRLDAIANRIAVPTYDRSLLRRSMVHIGVGGFHRSHLATYIHELCEAGHRDWGIVGSGIMAFDVAMAEALGSQDNLYSLITRGPSTATVEIIGSIVDYHLAVPAPDALLDAIANPETQIVSLTITEGGYPVDDSTGTFLPDSDRAGPNSAFGLIARGLDQRRRAGGGPVTAISCDNVMSNGAITRVATLGEAAQLSGELEAWVTDHVSFPNSMVDRITPATTDADRTWLAEKYGVTDRWPVVAEPFRQWVIEDDFAGLRPPLEEVGVIVTSDVEPYEVMKLRLLNAGHSCLAYLSALADISTVDEAMSNHAIRRFTVAFLEREAAPLLPPVAGIDVSAYTKSLVERFSNPQIGDQISRLCLDGSSKLPKFVLPTLRAQLAADGPVALTALALAAWCEYLGGSTQSGAKIEHSFDPLLDVALEHARAATSDPAAFLAFTEVFGDDLRQAASFRASFVEAVERLRSEGVAAAVDAALATID